MVNTILVNGAPQKVLDTRSSGPGNPPTTYVLTGRRFVEYLDRAWWLCVDNQRICQVDISRVES